MSKTTRVVRLVNVTLFIAFLAVTAVLVGTGQAAYPDRPITIIHGWGPGGAMDIFLRLIADSAAKKLGQSVLVESKPGGHGIIAAHVVVKSKPDGYTLGGGVSSQFVVIPSMQKVNFDPLNDPVQIMCFLQYDMGLVVKTDSPWKTFEDFKNYAKQHPGKIRYGTTGSGTVQHLALETVGQKEGIKWTNVPFQSGKESVVAVLGGHIEAAIQSPSDIVPYLETGQLRFLLALNDKRWPIAPGAPHLGELGYDTTFSIFSIYGPKGLPDPIRMKLQEVFTEAAKDPRVVETARKLQATLVSIPGKQYTEMLRERYPKYEKIVKDLKLGERFNK